MTPQSSPHPAGRPALHPLRFSYGTNGLTDLRLDDALSLLADLGYDGVGLTLDHMHLDPLAPDLAARTRRLARRLDELGLGVTLETGARYVLDPRRKHGPSLLDPDPDRRARRVDLLIRAVRIAGDLGAHAVHCFSGILPKEEAGRPDASDDAAWKRLAEALTPVLDAATDAGIPLAVEPEPGHLLATLDDFHRLRTTLGSPDALGLTLDIGHCQCLEEQSPADCVRAAAPWLRHVQIEDMRRGVHEHLPFGDGEIDFPPVLEALAATGYRGLVSVELPRHSHAGPQLAQQSLPFLQRAARPTVPGGGPTASEGRTP
ncbi:sugar phosphate isomerase/epimerase [Streptomyces aurantiacus]|uniref:sugar phosphate isomerase/epimerase family protein n=1 Tax=Streptomyces aurantiacus TaxID=47760 RepID=UPI002791BD99|nr:sugar phosphate isomerase/epimerase family protein [Streptomyces aurantiacus]MDQ0773313.1 sugar phosphate isomerase/epimerase [Streptomyces aurantiacus]